MQTLGTTEVTKSKSKNYVCEPCDYSTSQKANYEKHLSTGKHRKVTMVTTCNHVCPCGKSFTCRQHLHRHKKACDVSNNSAAKVTKVRESLPKVCHVHECVCGRTYKHACSLSKHKKTCLHGVNDVEPEDNTKVLPQVLNALTGLKEDNVVLKEDNVFLKEKLNEQAQDNKLLKEKLNDQAEQLNNLKDGVLTAVAEPKVININILLNDKCGDAIAIQDFAKSLMISMEDVDYALENGKVKGIENIIQKKFAELGVHKRPLHCTDVKRGTLYVKGEEGWEKEKGEMNKMIRDVECVQTTGIKVWSDANPEYSQGNQKLMDKWLRIVQCLTNSIDGIGVRKIEKRCQEMSKISQDEIG